MKQFKIKTSDFMNLKSVESIGEKETIESIKTIEAITGDKIIKNLSKGKNSVLMISESGKYYITARPCYIDSLVKILESVGIKSSDIVLMKKQSKETELSLEQLKQLILK